MGTYCSHQNIEVVKTYSNIHEINGNKFICAKVKCENCNKICRAIKYELTSDWNIMDSTKCNHEIYRIYFNKLIEHKNHNFLIKYFSTSKIINYLTEAKCIKCHLKFKVIKKYSKIEYPEYDMVVIIPQSEWEKIN